MKKWVSFLFILCLHSCTMHPKYCRPNMDLPSHWRVSTAEMECFSNINWWKEFGDTVLDGFICEALSNNQDLQVAINRVNEFVAKLGIARSFLYPQINATAEAGREKFSSNLESFAPATAEITNIFNLALNASYLVDIWGKIRSNVEASLANLLSEVETRRTVVLTIVSSVASTYILLKQLDKQLVVSKETLQTRYEAYDLAKIRFELGLTSEMQVQQALSEIESALVEVNRIEIGIGLQEDQLSVLLGRPPGPIKRGKLLDELIMPPSVPAELPSELLNQRPDILAAEQNLISANAEIGVAKANFFPQISLTGNYGVESSQLSNLFTKPSTIWQYGANIMQEIFTGGKLTYQLKLTQARKETLIHEYISTVLNAFREVNDALISHRISLKQVQEQKERVETLTQYLHLANLRYNDGLTDYLTFLDAERQLYRAQLEYAEAQGESFRTLINIYQALGGGWVIEVDKFATE